VGNTDGREEEVTSHGVRFVNAIINYLKGLLLASDAVDDNCPNQTPLLLVREHKTSKEELMASLKE
jgi:hypothetical protein